MLGVVVVPGDAIVVKKGEQLLAIPDQSSLHTFCCGASTFSLDKMLVESDNSRFVLAQEARLETVAVNRFNHRPDQHCEPTNEPTQFFVERFAKEIVIEISGKVDQTLLLWSFQAI